MTQQTEGMHPVAAGLVGAATVVAGATAVVLAQKENRDKIAKQLASVKKSGYTLAKKAVQAVEEVRNAPVVKQSSKRIKRITKK